MLDKLENNLLKFQKPGRYAGCEPGIPEKDFINAEVKFAICYPDTYEIGMSNLGIKIIYDRINRLPYATCERVFSPWTDCEEFLRNNDIPLFSLESKTPLNEFDFIGVSIQYELLFSNFLNILDLGKIEIFSGSRNEKSPIIICGGPGIVNPAPYKPFADLVCIGEAEEVVQKLIHEYKSLKKQKLPRSEILRQLSLIEGIYSPVYSGDKIITRQIYNGFSKDRGLETYISPMIDIVQNKHVVEIMRGCPNKCRFCQAGIIYKPFREKDINVIMENIENGLDKLGINEVTLSSLSSGDYSRIIELTELFTEIYKDRHISFSLPSIKVESFDIDLLDKLSIVRKSGITFAVESGSPDGQLSINKKVMPEKIKSIIIYGISKGWKLVKLYFMIGLPHIKDEKESIISFITDLLKISKKIKFNINLAVFVPKPHTPYQNERQLSIDESIVMLKSIKDHFKNSRAYIKCHDPYMSYLEGVISRGDEKVGLAVYEAFKNGAKFDGWDDMFNYELYKKAFEKNGLDPNFYTEGKPIDEHFFWDNIDVGMDKNFYKNENRKSKDNILTGNCREECDEYCKVCKSISKKISASNEEIKPIKVENKIELVEAKKTKVFLEFSKLGFSRFIGHIDLIKYFERQFNLSKIDIVFTEGFNPHPRMQFSQPLPLGLESECEILEIKTFGNFTPDVLLQKLREHQQRDISINRLKYISSLEKKSLINSLYLAKYCAFFDKIYYNKINKEVEKYNKSKLRYSINKNKMLLEGYYQDFLNLVEVKDDILYFDIKNINNIPKIIDSISFIFDNIPFKIRKLKMMTQKDGVMTDLFNLFDDR